MSEASRYWQLVRIDAGGNRRIQQIPAAKSFYAQVFEHLIPDDDVPDADIQGKLLDLYRHSSGETALFAERCLLCFLSWILEQGCLQLERKFGQKHNFTASDLFPYVLDDDGKLSVAGVYQCFAQKILQSFDSQQSSLTTWAIMKLKQQPELNKFLLECGVYLISNWALLNDTQPKQLERIFKEFHIFSQGGFSDAAIKEAKSILESYHTIYRLQRLQQRRKGLRSKCIAPDTQQLQDIAQDIQKHTGQIFEIEVLSQKLQKLAAQLREYRIYVRGGSVQTSSLDAVYGSKYNSLIEEIPATETNNIVEENDEQAEFLQFYRHQFQLGLQQALAQVTESRVRYLERKKGDKAKMFLIALELSQCQKLAMKEIAEFLGLRAQDSVTKLLKLKDLRTDVQQEMLVILKDSLKEKAKVYVDIQALKNLDERLTSFLFEEISQMLENSEIQSRTMKNHLKADIFAERLCEYIQTRKTN
ncbi:hypothetical protein H6G41_26510 [Tolypothrix sp. FACHB-123]|uniref:hypothetical protein n=1 Tax=Tolypothrix sp. FACHB-123 TaxID=2692868 RepID=UPI00168A2932|nr:hypothetical protein [Tolypothrix sp. FACHB-123]MBD2358121.1 hypothetical protein [Tolypothrix sp. FACHB-123]